MKQQTEMVERNKKLQKKLEEMLPDRINDFGGKNYMQMNQVLWWIGRDWLGKSTRRKLKPVGGTWLHGCVTKLSSTLQIHRKALQTTPAVISATSWTSWRNLSHTWQTSNFNFTRRTKTSPTCSRRYNKWLTNWESILIESLAETRNRSRKCFGEIWKLATSRHREADASKLGCWIEKVKFHSI